MNSLKNSNLELQEFAYIISHDLQEPLRAIISFSQLIEENYGELLDSEGKEFFSYILEGGKRMKDLISELLNYSRLSTRQKPLKSNNFNDLLNNALFNLKESIKESGAIITHDELPTLIAEKTQIVQLFQNLISNAIKFRSGNIPKIHIGVKENLNEWLFSVEDNGIGIDPEHFERIFKIFQRLHTRNEYPGTGVGLAICKKIVERHSGKIWLKSEIGKGSTFYFTIPKIKNDKF